MIKFSISLCYVVESYRYFSIELSLGEHDIADFEEIAFGAENSP
jgi:hypothetical protein